MKDSGPSRLGTVELFCVAAKAQSFTAAATSLGTTPSAISKAVQRLENRLGLKLFERTTRAIRLTDDGLAYYKVCHQALGNIQEMEEALTGHRMPRGVLRISLPYSYGIKRVIPLIPRYVERYMGHVKVEVSLSNALADFVKQDCDMAIRLGQIADSRLVVRRLHDAQLRLVASPAYLRRRAAPRSPDDLYQHGCLGLRLPDSGRILPWTFSVEGKANNDVAIRPNMTFDHPLGTLAAALSDAGIAQLLDFTVDDDLRSGRLVEVLADFRPAPQVISAVYPGNRNLSAKVRTFLDFLIEAN
ncbi:LysR family transcriptional regulator [Caballeronia terrestris]|jgi:DNA-binding transcriptional LysR family regulator|uniref:LysR family transcriptional regulator n=1 Tax=Caballeronia terrestris TaxID=1226301 RepID=A0A158KME0_9BURK|nr:LysR family transcriptional regulator [Caballeronia terrestris]SAL82292.1 LysR family transcriptional regulator [Caballeronia terrestris]